MLDIFIQGKKFFVQMNATECRGVKRKSHVDPKTDEEHEKTTKLEESLRYFGELVSTEWRIDEYNVIHPILVVR